MMDEANLSPLALSAKAAAEQVAKQRSEVGQIAQVARQTLLEATRGLDDATSRLPQCAGDVIQGICAGIWSTRGSVVAAAMESAVRTAHEVGAEVPLVAVQAMDAVERATDAWTADPAELSRAALSGVLAAADEHCQGDRVRQRLIAQKPFFAEVIAQLDASTVPPPHANRGPPPAAPA